MSSNLKLRHFLSHIDGPLIAEWVLDDDYATFFRNCMFLPSFEDCMNYPLWSQNLVMMVQNETGQTIGMVTGYHANFRSRTIKSGGLIDKNFRRSGYAYNAQLKWIEHLFNRRGLRKVIVEIVDEHLYDPFVSMGFKEEGRYKAEHEMDGRLVDEIRMGCLKEDFKIIYKNSVRDKESMRCLEAAKAVEAKVDLTLTNQNTQLI